MADPLSIAAGAASLLGASVKLYLAIEQLRTRFQRIPQTVSVLSSELKTTSAGLAHVQSVLRTANNSPEIMASSQQDQEAQLVFQCIDAASICMARSFSELDAELTKLNADDLDKTQKIAWRLRFMWVQNDLNTIAEEIRDQRSGLGWLIECINHRSSQMLKDIHRKLHTESPDLDALRRMASKARPPRPTVVTPPGVEAQKSCVDDLKPMLKRQQTGFPDLNVVQKNVPPTDTINPVSDPKSDRNQESSHIPTSPPNLNPEEPRTVPDPAALRGSYPNFQRGNTSPVMVHHDLHYAVANNDVLRVQYLMDNGGDPLGLPINPYGSLPNASKTSLALAAYLGREKVLGIFLQYGYGKALNEVIGNNLPPLLSASYSGQENVVRLFLSHGANPRLQSRGNSNSLFWAAARGHSKVVTLLLQTVARDDINLPNSAGLTPLMVAAQHGKQEVVELLLQNGADIHSQNKKLQSAIHLAAHGGHLECVRLLLTCHALVNSQTSNGKTPLMFACIAGYMDVAHLLINYGAYVDLADGEGRSPLYHAAFLGQVDAVELLLKQHASTETCSKKGDRSLHIACERGHTKVVGILLEHGARLEASRDEDGLDALAIAQWYKRKEVIAPLILFRTEQNSAAYSKETALYSAALWGLGEAMDALLEAGANIAHVDANGQTLLARAVRENESTAAALLIEKGAAVDVTDRFGATPLHRAARGANKLLAEHLMNAGADIEVRDKNGYTPLHLAAVYGTPDIVEFLISRGAYIESIIATSNKTPLIVAAENGRTDIVMTLMQNGVVLQDPVDQNTGPLFIVGMDGHTEVLIETVLKRLESVRM